MSQSHPFIFLCPVCQSEDSVEKNRCYSCGAEFRFTPEQVWVNDTEWEYHRLLQWMRENIPLTRRHPQNSISFPQISDPVLRVSRDAVLRQGIRKIHFTGYHALFRRDIEKPVPLTRGKLVITADAFYFSSSNQTHRFAISDLTCVTTNSHYFEFKIKGQPFYQIHFLRESPLKYEILFQKLIRNFYKAKGKRVLEFQPHVRCEPPECRSVNFPLKPKPPVHPGIKERILVGLLRMKLWIGLRLWIRPVVEGREQMPGEFPYLALANHQSIFDPFIIAAFLNHRIAFLTKSTSFSGWVERMVLKIGRGIPTTRYQTDPAVIRHIRQFLERGMPVGIFPEGERCWDGALQPFKFSVIRLLVGLRIPILPIVLQNSFAFMPRWAALPHRQKVTITVRAPFCLVPGLFSCQELKEFVEVQFRETLSPME